VKAITFSEHGASHVLTYEDAPKPVPHAGEVLLAVRAVSINHGPDI
jgi:acryloyl-coenzyme A reductase